MSVSAMERKIGILYAINPINQESFELGDIGNLDYTTLQDDAFSPDVFKPFSFSFSSKLRLQPKDKMKIFYGLTNNSIRMHGGKPIRRVPERFL